MCLSTYHHRPTPRKIFKTNPVETEKSKSISLPIKSVNIMIEADFSNLFSIDLKRTKINSETKSKTIFILFYLDSCEIHVDHLQTYYTPSSYGNHENMQV